MPDPSPDAARSPRHDRTAKIEELLLAGLDYYFAGEHDRAINVWTRVLFLDRGHARARAYIDRARGALAERQRESDELIQRGMAAFDGGQTAEARELLSSAVARGGPHDVALALLDRLNRLEPPAPGSDGWHDTPPPSSARAAADERRRSGAVAWLVAVLLLAVVAAAAFYVASSYPDSGGFAPPPTAQVGRSARPAPDILPLPRSADLALARARALFTNGHLKDALRALEPIRPGDPAHPDAERLRAAVETALLAGLPPVVVGKRDERR